MFTKNFTNMLLTEQFFHNTLKVDGKRFKSPLSITSAIGTWSNYYDLNENFMGTLCTQMATNKYGVVFGTDGTPATEDDYTFANGFISGIAMTVSKSSGAQDDTGGTGGAIEREYVIVNNNSEDITIREIGIWWKGLLLERTVLDNPVTIAPGEAGGIKYSLRYNCRLYT